MRARQVPGTVVGPARVVDLYRAARVELSRYGDAVAARTRALPTYLDGDGSEYRQLELEARDSHAELVRLIRSLCEVAGVADAVAAYERELVETVARTVARLGDPAGEEVVGQRPCSRCPERAVVAIDAHRPDQAARRYRACSTHVRPLVDELTAQGWSTSTVDLDRGLERR